MIQKSHSSFSKQRWVSLTKQREQPNRDHTLKQKCWPAISIYPGWPPLGRLYRLVESDNPPKHQIYNFLAGYMINWADQSSCIPVSYTYWLHITAGDFYQVATIDVIALHWILLCIPLRNVFLNAFITSISHLWCFSITCSKMLGFF